jgi:hypothetical protein
MWKLSRTLACALATVSLVSAAAPVLARRPGCQEILAARSAGQSVEQVAKTFDTTSAKVTACERFEEQRQRLANQRSNFYFDRAERGLDE